MKAVLHEHPLERYETVYEGHKIMDISGETVVPDKMPDIGLLGETTAHVLLRSKRAEQGCGRIEGELCASTFYIPDGEIGFQAVHMQLPWFADFESEEISTDSIVMCNICVINSETRMLNPRKILLKMKIDCAIQVFQRKQDSICDGIADAENDTIQVRRNSVECSVLSTVCEKTFVVADEYPLPPDLYEGEVIGKSIQFRVEDVKTLANKLIVKGSVLSDVMVASNDGASGRISFTSGFSFIAETDCEQISDNVTMNIIPTAIYYETASNGHIISMELHCVCQMRVYENKTITYISDAYSNFYSCDCDWKTINVHQNAKRMIHRENIFETIVCRSQIACVRFLTSSCTIHGDVDKNGITIHVGGCIQYENGSVDWVKKQFTVPIELKEGEQLTSVRLSDLRGSNNGTEIEFHITAEWETLDAMPICISHIAEVTCDEEQCLEQRKPTMTVVREGGSLWDLARKYRSTVKLIRMYNQLEDGDECVKDLLLIPTQRKQ